MAGSGSRRKTSHSTASPTPRPAVQPARENEYGAECKLEPTVFKEIRWFDPAVTKDDVRDIFLGTNVKIVQDIEDNLVILFPDRWSVDYFLGKNPRLKLHHVSPSASPVHQPINPVE